MGPPTSWATGPKPTPYASSNAAGALDAVRLKLSNVGGITATRRGPGRRRHARAAADDRGRRRRRHRHSRCDAPRVLDRAEAPPRRLPAIRDGRRAPRRRHPGGEPRQGAAPPGPGLGIEVDESALGERVLRIERKRRPASSSHGDEQAFAWSWADSKRRPPPCAPHLRPTAGHLRGRARTRGGCV